MDFETGRPEFNSRSIIQTLSSFQANITPHYLTIISPISSFTNQSSRVGVVIGGFYTLRL